MPPIDVYKRQLLDMDKAVSILKAVVANNEMVTIYHDYDVDGVTAGVTALSALSQLGVPVNHYCNDRITGGFGINAAGVNEIVAKFPGTKVLDVYKRQIRYSAH